MNPQDIARPRDRPDSCESAENYRAKVSEIQTERDMSHKKKSRLWMILLFAAVMLLTPMQAPAQEEPLPAEQPESRRMME